MYRNLRAEIVRKGWSIKDLAVFVGIPYSTLMDKMRGKTQFTLQEAAKIQEVLQTSLTIDNLFLP